MLKELYRNYLLKYYKKIIIGFIIGISGCLFIFIYCISNKEDNREITLNNDEQLHEPNTKEVKEEVKEEVLYFVDLKGAVNNPNVYQLKDGSRIIDAITLAGGLREDADTSIINLSKKVSDEMVIIIYTKDEIAKFKETKETVEEVIKYIEKECLCPDPAINDACLEENNDPSNEEESTLVSLNHATKDELMTLPGIGETKALDIIQYRTTNGEFKSLIDIKNVKGIGDSVFDKIKDFITL